MEKYEMTDVGFSRRKEEKYGLQLLVFSMGLFLCVTSSLIMITVVANFTLSYQVRNLLVEMNPGTDFAMTPYTFITTSTMKTTFPDNTEYLNVSRTTTPEEFTTEMKDITTVSDNTGTENLNITTVLPTEESTATTPKMKSPVIILNEINQKVKYFCFEQCSQPSVVSGQLNISLSGNGKGDNFLLITVPVTTDNVGVAKRRIAYYSLELLYKDQLSEALRDDEWVKPVPSDCEVPGVKTWENCQK